MSTHYSKRLLVETIKTGHEADLGDVYRKRVIADHPRSYWRLNDAGAPYLDQMGVDNLSILGAGLTPQQPGAVISGDLSLQWNDTASGGLQTTFGQGRNPSTDPVSYESWVRFSAASTSEMILSHGIGGSTSRLYMGLAGNQWGLGITTSSWSADPADVRDVGVWHYFCLVMDGENANLYRDNGTTPLIHKTYGSYTIPQPLRLGLNGDSLGYYHRGRLDEIAVYEYALTEAQRLAHYAAALQEGCPSIGSQLLNSPLIRSAA